MGAYARFALRRSVIVNLKDGTAVQGVFWRQAGPLIVIANAVLLEQGQEPTPLDGEIIIERDQIRFIQAP